MCYIFSIFFYCCLPCCALFSRLHANGTREREREREKSKSWTVDDGLWFIYLRYSLIYLNDVMPRRNLCHAICLLVPSFEFLVFSLALALRFSLGRSCSLIVYFSLFHVRNLCGFKSKMTCVLWECEIDVELNWRERVCVRERKSQLSKKMQFI